MSLLDNDDGCDKSTAQSVYYYSALLFIPVQLLYYLSSTMYNVYTDEMKAGNLFIDRQSLISKLQTY